MQAERYYKPILELKYTKEKGCREVAFFSLKKDGDQTRPEYEEPHSLVCSATCEDEESAMTLAMSEPFVYICAFINRYII